MAKELIKAPDSLSVWNSNIKELVSRQPQLGAVLVDYVEKHGHSFAHYENKTPAGTWIEGLSPEPFFQPDEDPQVGWTKKDRESPIFFQYGAGTPPYLFKVIRSLPAEALALVVVEPNVALLAYVLHMTHVYAAMPQGATIAFVVQPTEVPDTLRLVKQDSEDESLPIDILKRTLNDEALQLSLTVQGLFTAGLAKIAIHPGEEKAFGETLSKMAHDVREWVLMSLNYLGNSSHDTMLGLRQMSLMSPWIVYGYQYDSLLEDFKGRPFVVVSAGPSLEKNFELLRDIQDKAVIVANDAILQKLLAAGIRPHIVCALERGILTYDAFFKEVVHDYREECKNILLIDQAVCTPKLFGTWPGPKIITGKNEIPVDQWFIDGTIHGKIIPSGLSVSHMCLGVAATMGASEVALIGQDLAYGESGVSHTKGVYDDEMRERLKRPDDGKSVYKVPGIDGGEVETSEIWLSFLRLFESRIASLTFPVYDCSEGGALIKGTIVRPFADFISEFVEKAQPLEKTPTEVINSAGPLADRRERYEYVQTFFDNAYADIEEAGDIILKLAQSLDRVAAPGLPSKRRVVLAAETAALLDRLNHINPMFAFIAQSYLYLSTAEIAITRFLDSVDVVERWVRLHREIVEGHVTVIRFIKTWLDYSVNALKYYVDTPLPMEPVDPERSYDEFKRICETLGEGHDQTALRCEMDALFTFDDMVRDGWPGEALWQCAMFLLQEGRSEEASVLMTAAEKYFDGREMPTSEIAAFLKDYTRVGMTPDLCYIPNYDFALVILKNAEEAAGGEDDEIRALRLEIMERQQSLMIEVGVMLGAYRRDHLTRWYTQRGIAQNALSSGDAMESFKVMWAAIRDCGRDVPVLAIPHFYWLVKQMEKFFGFDDERVKPVIDGILDDMAQNTDVVKALGVQLTSRFAEELSSRGGDISFLYPVLVPEQETVEA